jgi:hypothetical protein
MSVGFRGVIAGRAVVRVACPDGEQVCNGRVRLHLRVHGRDVTLGSSGAFRLAGGQLGTLRIPISREARRAIARAGAVLVKVKARDAAGNLGVVDRRFTV